MSLLRSPFPRRAAALHLALTRAFIGLSVLTVLLAACGGDAAYPSAPITTEGRRIKPPTTTSDSGTSSASSSSDALSGATFWVDPNSPAAQQVAAWQTTDPTDAAEIQKIAIEPQAAWFGNWNTNIASDVNALVSTVTSSGAVPLLVAYNIPYRDCGGLSGGNNETPSGYQSWITAFAQGIGARRAVVVLEPDALAGMDCLSSTDQQTRLSLLAYAVKAFKALGATFVYIDAGHPQWQSASTMATRLTQADVVDATGFSLNVSNFFYTSDNVGYGAQISSLVGGKHFIVDTGRNGLGPTSDNQWCNPSGRALGDRPTTVTGSATADAFLWIKPPGESDGTCNGGPAAGQWWASYALGLAQLAAY